MPIGPECGRIAVTRPVSASLAACELTHLPRMAIDIDRARRQHEAYEDALRSLGCGIETLPEETALADSVFVEDTAIVLDELAIITRPGAQSRRAETPSVASVLGQYRVLERIDAPGTLDGGDVLRVDRTLYVGQSSRSNRSAVEQLHALVSRFGYRVEAVPVRGCLHLKSAVTQVTPEALLINSQYVDRHYFAGLDTVDVDAAEPLGANALLIGQAVIYPESNSRTAERLRRHGVQLVTVDVSELEKAEGAVSCCSLILTS